MPTDYHPKHDIFGVLGGHAARVARRRIIIAALHTDNVNGKWFDDQYIGRHAIDSVDTVEQFTVTQYDGDVSGYRFIGTFRRRDLSSGVLPGHPSGSSVRGEHGVPERSPVLNGSFEVHFFEDCGCRWCVAERNDAAAI